MPPAPFTDILLGGLAPDGGLAVPDHYPQVAPAELAAWRALGYRELAFEILSRFIDDIPPAHLRDILSRTYTAEAFGSDEITPVTTLEAGLHLLHLSNGPTLAFKDIAMQLLGSLFEYVLAQRGEELNILGATSGDTGSAAEYAMKGKRGVRVFMLSPEGKMSPFQTAQMYSLQDANIFNIAVRGVFDDCQDMVKAVSNDLAFKAKHRIGTVNSINWARLVAQVVYYFKGYFAVTASNEERVTFSVPSGNFGNVCAGHVARMMGLPIAKLVVATNENDVLDEFFRTGRYRVRASRDVAQTTSPSMDISKASNFERFVYDLVGRDPRVVRDLWAHIDRGGEFDLAHAYLHGGSETSASYRAAARTRSGCDDSSLRAASRDRRHAYGGRHQGGSGAAGRRSAGVPRDRAAGQVRRNHPRSPRTRPRPPGCVRGHRTQPLRSTTLTNDAEAHQAYIAAHARP